MIELPKELSLYLVSCSGALLLWIKVNMGSKKVHGLGDLLEKLIPNHPGAQYILQFLFFVFFGGYIGILAVTPTTSAQALAGGMAWSRLTAKD